MGEFFKQPLVDGDVAATFGQFVSAGLSKGAFKSVLVPVEAPQGPAVMQALVTDQGKAGRINPLIPVMPNNAGTLVGRITAGGAGKKIAAFLRPCEIRAVVELVKLKQASMENLIVIGMDCGGTVPVRKLAKADANGGFSKTAAKAFESIRDGAELPAGLKVRKACKICPFPEAGNADIRLCTFGGSDDSFVFEAVTEKGKAALKAVGLAAGEQPAQRQQKLGAAREARGKARAEALKETGDKTADTSKMLEVFSACIRCGNCRNVCPICYCPVCTFATPAFEYEPGQYYKWAQRKGALRMPVDTILFHLTRANHMAHSCIGCGMCTSACPSDIPVGDVFQALQEKVDKIFDYTPGKSVDEPLPVQTYKEEELSPR